MPRLQFWQECTTRLSDANNAVVSYADLKIALLIDSLGSGGAQKQICILAAGLARRGMHVEVFTYFPKQDHFKALLESAGVPIRSVHKSHRFSITTPLVIAWIMRREGFTCVISFLPT